jgi:hypothetical protein
MLCVPITDEVCRLVRDEGLELGHADDLVFGRTNSKTTNGACGLLTGVPNSGASFLSRMHAVIVVVELESDALMHSGKRYKDYRVFAHAGHQRQDRRSMCYEHDHFFVAILKLDNRSDVKHSTDICFIA